MIKYNNILVKDQETLDNYTKAIGDAIHEVELKAWYGRTKAEQVFNEVYPKEIRCGNNLFEGGLFKKGFIEGYNKCEEDISKKIL